MRWSKLRQLVKERFSDSMRSRVDLNSAAYGACSCGHAWITLDGEMLANFCTRSFFNQNYAFLRLSSSEKSLVTDDRVKQYKNQFVEYGELSRQIFYEECWTYIHDLSMEQALNSESVLIQSLAVLDKRVGKRRMKKLNTQDLKPLSKHLFEQRINIEFKNLGNSYAS